MSLKKNIAIIADDLTLGSPAQQILDRFLIGYTRDDVFEARPFEKVTVCVQADSEKLLEQRKRDFRCDVVESPKEAVASANAVIVLSNEGLAEIIETIHAETPVFVHGLIGKNRKAAEAAARAAEERRIPICAGTVMSVLQELPPMEISNLMAIGAQIREALIVVEGSDPQAELNAFDAIAPILERNGGIRGIHDVRTLEGQAVWDAGTQGDWSWRMLASALSRTDKAQGNTLLDGRTEDIVGLGLTQKMAINPRAHLIDHARGGDYTHGLRTTILVLDGVVGDILVAVKAGRRLMPGSIYSTQLFQSPSPQQEHYSRLAAVTADFFITGKPPWDTKRAIIAADFAGRLRK
jgi:hypothetical protein